MTDALAQWLEPFWRGMALHLWQTSLFLAGLGAVALLLRNGSARILSPLYWTGILKLLLPLPFLAPATRRVAAALWAALDWGPSATEPWNGGVVLMYPSLLVSGPERAALFPVWASSAWTLFWLLGVVLLIARSCRPASRVRVRSGSALPPTRARLDAALAGTGLDSRVIRVAADGSGPLVCGVLRPAVVVPETIVAALDRKELRAVLIHEFEHRRRRDPMRYALLRLVCASLFFFPPVWWLARRIRETAEMACDEAVARAGLPAETYCRSLARTLAVGLGSPTAAPVGILNHRTSFLRRRLERIRSGRRFEIMKTQRFTVIVAAVLAVVASLLPIVPSEGLHAGVSRSDEGLERLEGATLPVSLSFEGLPVETVLQALAGATGLEIRVMGLLPKGPVDIHMNEEPLVEALKRVAAVAGLKYHVVDSRVLEVQAILLPGKDGVESPRRIEESLVVPVYPEEARKEGLGGRVILQAVIDRDGRVTDVEVLSVVPERHEGFVKSAEEAVRQWRYEPATKDGTPVDVYFTIRVDFRLDEHGPTKSKVADPVL